jgi:plastocyanin
MLRNTANRIPRLVSRLVPAAVLMTFTACSTAAPAAPTQAPPTLAPATRAAQASPSALAQPSPSAQAGGSPGAAPVGVPSPNAAARTFTIQLTDGLRFDPAEQTVPVGSTVIWTNTSSIQHTVTDDASKAEDKTHAGLPQGAEAWDSGMLDPGKTFQHVFTVPGTYHYFCIPHESAGMLGTIVVQG